MYTIVAILLLWKLQGDVAALIRRVSVLGYTLPIPDPIHISSSRRPFQ